MREEKPRENRPPITVSFIAPQTTATDDKPAKRERTAPPKADDIFAPPPKKAARPERDESDRGPGKGSEKPADKSADKSAEKSRSDKPRPAKGEGKSDRAQDKGGDKPSRRRRVRGSSSEEETVESVDTEESDEDFDDDRPRRRGRRGRRGRGRGKGGDAADEGEEETDSDKGESEPSVTRRRRRKRTRAGTNESDRGSKSSKAAKADDGEVVVKVRKAHKQSDADVVQGVSGSTRLEAKRQRRREGRRNGKNRLHIVSEAEFLARREAVDRELIVRAGPTRSQAAVLEDEILVEHYVSTSANQGLIGNVYLGKVQNVLPSMEAAFVDIGRGRNAVLYAGEVNWDATGLSGKARSIEQALRPGDTVLVQVTKDPIGHKGARLTSHIALSGRHLVYVPGGNASGISRKLPDRERTRLRTALKKLVPESAGVIVRTAAEGAGPEELARDISRLQIEWEEIQTKSKKANAPALLHAEPDVIIRVVRDMFNEDFKELVVEGEEAYNEIHRYLEAVSPELLPRLKRYAGTKDVFAEHRIDEQLIKAMDRKVYLPSGGSLVIDKTEAMTVIDVNTGRFTGEGGNLEETVTRNNLEAAEEIVRQLRLRDIGGIIVIDFIDMVLESNRELVLRRLTESLGRDRTKHQVTEVTSLGLVQMTRKRVGQGLVEAFSETCDCCKGRGLTIHTDQILYPESQTSSSGKKKKKKKKKSSEEDDTQHDATAAATAKVAAAAHTDEAPAEEEKPEPVKTRKRTRKAKGKSQGRAEGGSESEDKPKEEPEPESKDAAKDEAPAEPKRDAKEEAPAEKAEKPEPEAPAEVKAEAEAPAEPKPEEKPEGAAETSDDSRAATGTDM
ncbi:Rne/Rng family ribonuclease [Salininema proteolyticum]|uniref:Rne/Rng family ribonuclease n=1 Tax=Salininema proteolyticum TaxID=1607685 RepID=A0ABV8TW63_9ACTN